MCKWIIMIACTLSFVNTAMPMGTGLGDEEKKIDFVDIKKFTTGKEEFEGLDIKSLHRELRAHRKENPDKYQQCLNKLDQIKTEEESSRDNPETVELTTTLLSLSIKNSQCRTKAYKEEIYWVIVPTVFLIIFGITVGSLSDPCG